MLSPRLKNHLSNVTTHEEAFRLWRDHENELSGYSFLLAEAEGAGALHFPAHLDFPQGGHLRSVFAHDTLFLVNNDLLDKAAAHAQSRIRVDYTLAFDANVATYLRSWHQGKSVPVVEMLQSVFRALNAGRFNWDLLPFLLERSSDIIMGRDLKQIYETQLAATWFSASDRAHFAQTGEIRLTVSENEIVRRAQSALADWSRKLNAGMSDMIQQRFHLFHACLLKIVLLQLEHPSPAAAALKLERWLEFMHNDLQMLLMLPTRAALEFFQKGGAFKPMAKVATRSPRLRPNVRNVTWDFMQLIWRHTFAGFNTRVEGLFIPYLLTFDRGLADLYDIHPQRSCLFGKEVNPPQFFGDIDLPSLIESPFPELAPLVSSIFNVSADQERQRRRQAKPPQCAAIAKELEQSLCAFENPNPLAPSSKAHE